MTAEEFDQRIARRAFRDALGLRKDMAETLAEPSRTGHGRDTAHRVLEELRASFRAGLPAPTRAVDRGRASSSGFGPCRFAERQPWEHTSPHPEPRFEPRRNDART